jgi:hypothetical protein
MLRSNSTRKRADTQRGMMSLFFLVVLVPFLMLLLCLGLELTHFFGVHDDIQRVLDRETRASLTKGTPSREVERTIALNIARFNDIVDVSSISSVKTSSWSETNIKGRFRGVFSEIIFRLAGTSDVLLPVHVKSRVRKVSSRSLFILDRTVLSEAAACSDPDLLTLESFLDQISESMLRGGNGAVQIAVFPGSQQPVELLSQVEGGDLLERCRLRRPGALFDVSGLAGIARTLPADEVAVATQQLIVSELFKTGADARSVVLLQSAELDERNRYSERLFSILSDEMQKQMTTLIGIHIRVGSSSSSEVTDPIGKSGGVFMHRVSTTREELAHPHVRAAVQGRIGERTLLVF